MSYKEVFSFIAKCLTISLDKRNRAEIALQLNDTKVDWNLVVKVSTAHYVLPALYCNLKKANLLAYLPEELVAYMIHITGKNITRNKALIKQALAVNTLFLSADLVPVFLKGTGNLIEGLYEDIGERMIGDIDIIFSKDDYIKAIAILKANGYHKIETNNYEYPQFMHYPKLYKKGSVASIEIHKELVAEKYADVFNYNLVKMKMQRVGGIHVISYKMQLNMTAVATQINDSGFFYNNLNLRNAYDVFLLSKKCTITNAFNGLVHLEKPINCFIASCYEIFNKPLSLRYLGSRATIDYLHVFYQQLNNDHLRLKAHKRITQRLLFKERLTFVKNFICKKEYRSWAVKVLTNRNTYKELMKDISL